MGGSRVVNYCILHDTRTMRPIKDFNSFDEAAHWLSIRLNMYGPDKFAEYLLSRYDDGNSRGSLSGENLYLWLVSGANP